MPVRGNFWDGDAFVIIENDYNRVTGDKTDDLFEQVNVFERHNPAGGWVEVFVWDAAEWRESWNEAFEAILGVIARVATGVRVTRKPPADDPGDGDDD